MARIYPEDARFSLVKSECKKCNRIS